MHTALTRAETWVLSRGRPLAIGLGVLILGTIPLTVYAIDTGTLDKLSEFILAVTGWLFQIYVSLMGSLLLLLVDILIQVAGYNNFVQSPAVTQGWVIVRDVCNMFFIVVLLVIAFSTIFGQEKYGLKYLPKLLIMAVVINFSKTIVGLFIDASQVIMLTFVNGFAAAAGGNFVQALNINQLLDITPDKTGAGLTHFNALISLGLAAIMVTVATGVVFGILFMLVWRIVMLWMLTVLSPAAFFLGAVPFRKAESTYSDWWEQLTNYLLIGPVLAFFLWLSLLVVGSGQAGAEIARGSAFQNRTGSAAERQRIQQNLGGEGATANLFASEAGQPDRMTSFFIAVGMLLASIVMANEFGEAGKKFGSGIARAQIAGKGAWGTTKGVGRAGFGAVKRTGSFIDDKAKIREGVLGGVGGVLGKIPLVGANLELMTMRAKAGIRAKRDATAEKKAAFASHMTPEERTRYLSRPRPLIRGSADEALRAAVLKLQLTEKSTARDFPDMPMAQRAENDAQRRLWMQELDGMARESNDPKLQKEVGDIKEKRPDFAWTGQNFQDARDKHDVGYQTARLWSENALEDSAVITQPNGHTVQAGHGLIESMSAQGRREMVQRKGGRWARAIQEWEHGAGAPILAARGELPATPPPGAGGGAAPAGGGGPGPAPEHPEDIEEEEGAPHGGGGTGEDDTKFQGALDEYRKAGYAAGSDDDVRGRVRVMRSHPDFAERHNLSLFKFKGGGVGKPTTGDFENAGEAKAFRQVITIDPTVLLRTPVIEGSESFKQAIDALKENIEISLEMLRGAKTPELQKRAKEWVDAMAKVATSPSEQAVVKRATRIIDASPGS